MSQTYTIIAIIGFSLAAVLAIVAVGMFFGLHVKQVHDNLTGKTAARSIAEIRSRARARKRPASSAARSMGWEPGAALDDPASFAAAASQAPGRSQGLGTTPLGAEGPGQKEDAPSTVALGEEYTSKTIASDDVLATTVLDDDASETTVLDDDAPGTVLLSGHEGEEYNDVPATRFLGEDGKASAGAAGALLVLAVVCALAAPAAMASAVQDGLASGLGAANRPEQVEQALLAMQGRVGQDAPGAGETQVASLGVSGGKAEPLQAPGQARAATVEVSVREDTAVLTVPYGADIATWLSEQDVFQSKPGYGHDVLANLFEDGLIVTYKGTSYPQPGSLVAARDLDWGTAAADSTTIIGGDLSKLTVNMAALGDPWTLEGMATGGDPAASHVTGSGGAARLWVPAGGTLTSENQGNGKPMFSFVQKAAGDPASGPGDFAGANGSLTFPAGGTYPVDVYAQAQADLVFNKGQANEVSLAKGQIVKLPPVLMDQQAPNASGNMSVSGGRCRFNTLYAQGLSISVPAADNPVTAEGQSRTCAGLASAALEYDDDGRTREISRIDLSGDNRGAESYGFSLSLSSGRYQTAGLYVRLADMAGNSQRIKVSDLFAADGSALPTSLKRIVVSQSTPKVSLTYDSTEQDGCYRRRTATVAIDDHEYASMIEWYKNLTAEEKAAVPPVLTLVNTSLANDDPNRNIAVTIGQFAERDDTSSPSVQVALANDGSYRLADDNLDRPTYEGMVPGLAAAWATGSDTAPFIVDATPPVAGAVTMAPTSTVQWGWLFSQGPATVDFALSDALSGVDSNALALTSNGVDQQLSWQADAQSPLNGTATWNIPADDTAVSLSGAVLSYADKAGNAGAPVDVEAHGNKNLDVQGIFADGAAPVIGVAFDNEDTRNGKYYNAVRTATITLTEASFGFVQSNDPRRVVATQTFNGTVRDILAEDFQNPSGDGVTWEVAVPCQDDGTYRITAAFTDPSGRQAEPYDSGEFIVDTVAPVIMVTFDNNDAHNGFYFNAPRTATVTVHEQNFSVDLASIAATASDAAGAAASAPGIGIWVESPADVHTVSIGFADELHYTLTANCTDLAGNVAETVEVPEFVIDMTAPTVTIDRIENQAAYRDEVAPLVTFGDTNFQPFLAQATLTGSAQGQVYFSAEDSQTATSRTIDYQDFAYELDVDDVYTLSAEVEDLAGNTAAAQATFSVNRYGSNYQVAETSQPLLGAYMRSPQDLVVIETNVSGLAASSARLAYNDKMSVLEQGKSYAVDRDAGSAWSRYVYTFPADLFQSDGYYRIVLASTDVAGGYSENLMEGKNANRTGALNLAFAVDSTAPVAHLANVASGTAYYTPSLQVDALASDNMEAERAVLRANGQVVGEWGAEEMDSELLLSCQLDASDQPQTMTLEVTDKAGNVSTSQVRNVVVTNDLLRYIAATPAILYPLVAAGVLVAAAGAALAARLVARRRGRAAQR